MIKFFRKIRQKLLTENKFSKYLIYAIGEILLVIIGIFIALQINNWNELRKSEKQIISVLKEVHSEVADNIKEADELYLDFVDNDTLLYNISGNSSHCITHSMVLDRAILFGDAFC